MLLDEIIDLATDNKQSITILLRKCLVLSSQLKNERLKVWANQELSGYGEDDSLPAYRTTPSQTMGQFIVKRGPYGGQHYTRNIPSVAIEENHRWATEAVHMVSPVSAYENALSEEGPGGIRYPWDSNLVLYYQEKLISGSVMLSAWQDVPKSALAGLVDTIRTNVLNMALEIKDDLGDGDLKQITAQAAKRVDQAVTNHIYGGNVYVSTGQSTIHAATIHQQQQNIVAGNWEQLAGVLRNSGISDPELDELSTAFEEEGRTTGAKVKGWIERTAPKVLSGGVKIGATVGQALLLEYLKQYCGLK